MGQNYTISKGHFSGKYVLRIWDRHGETIHNSIHDLPHHARAELERFQEASRKEAALDNLPIVSIEDGLRRRTGQPTPNETDEKR